MKMRLKTREQMFSVEEGTERMKKSGDKEKC